MADIVFAAFNARYAHSSFGARYLLANLGELQGKADLIEFDLQVQPRVAVEKLLAYHPRIISIGCYIWNIDLATQVAALLKSIRPDISLILGGPEISYETEAQEIFRYADHIICGEGEVEFPKLCRKLLGRRDACDTTSSVPQASRLPRIIKTEAVDVMKIELPYDLYTDEDIAHRAIYVEASRGCPFRCEYCMSSLDPCVRYFPEEKLFSAFGKLLDRGARNFKFVDRTFNIDIAFALKVLAFFRERYDSGMMLHFEVIPSRLPEELMDAVADCPPGMLQFEVGIQTFNEAVAHRIQRPLNIAKIEANLRRLRDETGVHIHSDLIAGLPGEDLESFEAGFNRLLALHPQEIQLGILKRLRGAPIDRHSTEWQMIYSPHAPYEILQTSLIPFEQMQRVQRFARYWNLTVNNGQFIHTAPLIWQDASSPFAAFMQWSDWLYAKTNTTGNLHMVRLAQLLLEFLTAEKGMGGKTVAESLSGDYQRGNRTDIPGFLKKLSGKSPLEAGDTPVPPAFVSPASSRPCPVPPASSGLPRQSRHQTLEMVKSAHQPAAAESPVPSASNAPPETTGFNPHQEIHQTQRKNLPHWTQDECSYFVTFRLVDSIAQSRINEYEELRRKWQEHHHPPYSETERERFNELFSKRVDHWLDEGAGSCILKNPALSQLVADTLTHFDGDRYELDEWVIMPNHVHVLVRPLGQIQLADILHSWKSFSANRINQQLKTSGPFWKKEYYDHIVRDMEELLRIRKYIRNNPAKAGIRVAHCSSPQDASDTAERTAGILPAFAESPLEAGDTPASNGLPHQPKEKT
jgi:radical SAM superfamily enzyme YgiQ (UPF0313 family)/REP element-mobilizing transposase RayT